MNSETPNPQEAHSSSQKKSRIDRTMSAQGFADAVSAMSRFLDQISGAAMLKGVNLELNEWTLLSSLEQESRPGKKLIKKTGLAKEQGRLIIERLKGKGCLASEAQDGNLVLTSEGRRQLDAVNERVAALLVKFKEKAGAFQKIGKNLRALTRLIGDPQSAEKKARKREKRKAREKTDAADD